MALYDECPQCLTDRITQKRLCRGCGYDLTIKPKAGPEKPEDVKGTSSKQPEEKVEEARRQFENLRFPAGTEDTTKPPQKQQKPQPPAGEARATEQGEADRTEGFTPILGLKKRAGEDVDTFKK